MSKRILVVEDQPDNRQIIRDMLAPTDYEITEVESGEEALAAIAKLETKKLTTGDTIKCIIVRWREKARQAE
jgi:CheY-like chemotaxis protein